MANNNKREVVVITGASAGVGRATAMEFARRKAKIGLIARNQERLEGACVEVESLGGTALALPADVANAENIEAAADSVENKFGPVDIWVNNAMITVFSPFKEITPQEFKRVTEVTYLGVVYGTMAALRRMLSRNHGCIVEVGSALAFRSIPLQSAYCGAKHAIRGFVNSLHSELLHDRSKIRLTMVHLPAVNTPQFEWCKTRMPNYPQPVPPIFQPELAAKAIIWAAHHNRRDVYVGGSTTKAVWANKIAPSVLDHYLAETNYSAQQTSETIAPDRPSNLFEPVPGHQESHGPFDSIAHGSSLQFWGTIHRSWIALAGSAGLCLGLWALKKNR